MELKMNVRQGKKIIKMHFSLYFCFHCLFSAWFFNVSNHKSIVERNYSSRISKHLYFRYSRDIISGVYVNANERQQQKISKTNNFLIYYTFMLILKACEMCVYEEYVCCCFLYFSFHNSLFLLYYLVLCE